MCVGCAVEPVEGILAWHQGECILPSMKAPSAELQIVTRKGKPVSVIIPIEAYQDLLERVEDAADLEWLRKARRKPLQYRSLEQYLAARKTK
jgi:hypothetical protein